MSLFAEAARLGRYVWRLAARPEFLNLHGFKIRMPVGAQGKVRASLYAELYERHEVAAVGRKLKPEDVVVEAGAAIGYVGLHCARIVGVDNVHLFEANPALKDEIINNFKRNDFSEPKLATAVASHSDDGPVDFHVAEQFWSSSTLDRGVTTRTVAAPRVDLNRIMKETGATVFICDIEGGEFALIPNLDLSGLRLAIVEVHDALAKDGELDAFDAAMDASGMELVETVAGEVRIYER